jgi:hypothetical protein
MSLVYLLLAYYVTAAVVAAQQPPSPPQSLADGYLSAPAVGQIILFLTTVLGFVITIYRENRNRRWDLEDRERTAKALVAQVDTVSKTLATKTAASHDALATKIDENTELTATAISKASDAYKEANDVNQKLARLTELFTKVERDVDKKRAP